MRQMEGINLIRGQFGRCRVQHRRTISSARFVQHSSSRSYVLQTTHSTGQRDKAAHSLLVAAPICSLGAPHSRLLQSSAAADSDGSESCLLRIKSFFVEYALTTFGGKCIPGAIRDIMTRTIYQRAQLLAARSEVRRRGETVNRASSQAYSQIMQRKLILDPRTN